MLPQKRPEFVEIASRRALSNEDLLSEGDFFASLVDVKTFVVCFDAGLDIGA